MGMFSESGSQEIDIVKEMAEGLGSQGAKIEELLEKAHTAEDRVNTLLACYHGNGSCDRIPDVSKINDSIREYNRYVDKAEDALRWLLIQREACGFRTHRNVNFHYPIPSKMKLIAQ
ncbi:MAG TPA: hypothetical protein VK463_04420 [Desulfomonilaceae bacterium]|nr:hypothetical protein [Desulfomonilaceae bacterium]